MCLINTIGLLNTPFIDLLLVLITIYAFSLRCQTVLRMCSQKRTFFWKRLLVSKRTSIRTRGVLLALLENAMDRGARESLQSSLRIALEPPGSTRKDRSDNQVLEYLLPVTFLTPKTPDPVTRKA